MRGIAILMVLVNHTAQSIVGLPKILYDCSEFGKYGVQLFFIMSAYTLCLSKQARGDEQLATKKYFIRRYFRIAPLYYVGILLYGSILLFGTEFRINTFLLQPDYSMKAVLFHITFLHGLTPAYIHSVVPGGWSIGTEMLFYLLFPVLFSALSRMSSKWLLIAIPMIVALFISAFFRLLPHIFPPLSRHNFEFYYCTVLNQLPVFLTGMVLFFLFEELTVSRIKAFLFVCGFFSMAAMIVLITSKNISDVTLIPFLVGIAFLFLFFGIKTTNSLNPIWLQKIGQLSFSIYVFHFIFAWWFSSFLNQVLMPYINCYIIYLLCILLTVAFSVLLSGLTKWLIEDRGIQLGKSLIKIMNKNKLVNNHE